MMYLCDWWLPSRSKCPKEATEEVADQYGAPLRFCKEHRPLAHVQYPLAEQYREASLRKR